MYYTFGYYRQLSYQVANLMVMTCMILSVLFVISVVFPQDLLERGLNASNFAMLGLGDIVIPGEFTTLAQHHQAPFKYRLAQFYCSTEMGSYACFIRLLNQTRLNQLYI